MVLSLERRAWNLVSARSVSAHCYPPEVSLGGRVGVAQHSLNILQGSFLVRVTGNASCSKFVLFYTYVVMYHCNTILTGKQIVNSVITMTNNKQDCLLLALREINQPEVAFPAPPPTPRRELSTTGKYLQLKKFDCLSQNQDKLHQHYRKYPNTSVSLQRT